MTTNAMELTAMMQEQDDDVTMGEAVVTVDEFDATAPNPYGPRETLSEMRATDGEVVARAAQDAASDAPTDTVRANQVESATLHEKLRAKYEPLSTLNPRFESWVAYRQELLVSFIVAQKRERAGDPYAMREWQEEFSKKIFRSKIKIAY